MPDADESRDPRVYFAAERTFLAWIRTGVALMGFGFVIARFGLFLRQLASIGTIRAPGGPALSAPLGTSLVIIGVVVNVLACVNHVRLIRDLNRGQIALGRPSILGLVVALLLAATGLAMALYLAQS